MNRANRRLHSAHQLDTLSEHVWPRQGQSTLPTEGCTQHISLIWRVNMCDTDKVHKPRRQKVALSTSSLWTRYNLWPSDRQNNSCKLCWNKLTLLLTLLSKFDENQSINRGFIAIEKWTKIMYTRERQTKRLTWGYAWASYVEEPVAPSNLYMRRRSPSTSVCPSTVISPVFSKFISCSSVNFWMALVT